jgi:hypothetical protein
MKIKKIIIADIEWNEWAGFVLTILRMANLHIARIMASYLL